METSFLKERLEIWNMSMKYTLNKFRLPEITEIAGKALTIW